MSVLLGGFQWGPLYLRYAWLGAFLGLLAAYALTPFLLRAAGVPDHAVRGVRDRHTVAFALFVAVWKFFAPLLDPAAVAARPLLLLLSPPTSAGMAAGIAAAALYLAASEFRSPLLPRRAWFAYYAGGAVVAVWTASPFILLVGRAVPFAPLTVSLHGTHYVPANLIEMAALTPTLWRIVFPAFHAPTGHSLANRENDKAASPAGAKTGWEALFGLGAATLAASLFVFHRHTALGLSGLQWGALAAGVLGARGIAAGKEAAKDRTSTRTRP